MDSASPRDNSDVTFSDRLLGIGLAAAFLILISIIGEVAFLGLNEMEKLHNEAREIAERQWLDVQLATTALSYSGRNTRLNDRILVSANQEEIDLLLAERAENTARISASIAKLQTRIDSPREGQLLQDVINARAAYRESYQAAVNIFLKDKNAAAAHAYLMQNTLPLLLKYHASWDEFIQFQTTEMNNQLRQGSAEYARARQKALILVVLCLSLAIAIASFAVPRVLVEVLRRRMARQDLRLLNEELERKVQQRTAALENSNAELAAEVSHRRDVQEQLLAETAFLEAQTNSTIDGILVVDSNDRKMLQNRKFTELLRLPARLIATNDDKVTLEYVAGTTQDPDQFLQKVRYLNEHKDLASHDELVFKDGRILDRYTSPVIGADGKYYGRVWTFRDITQRKQNEEMVRRLSLAVEQSPVSVVITDLEGRIVYVNRNFVECTGYTCEEVIGKNPRILKSGNTSAEEYMQLWQTINAGNVWRGEFHNRKKNGELYWEQAVIRPITDEKGKISHFLALKEDITERRNMEAQLLRAQKLEAVGELAAGIAHEINTPIQFVGDNTRFVQEAWASLDSLFALLYTAPGPAMDEVAFRNLAERLSRLDLDEFRYLQKEVPNALSQSLDGIDRVRKIVQAIKEFSHPGSDQKKLTNINQAIETAITVARNEWKYVADLETFLSPDVGLVPCHTGEFNQVILNLLVNAAHAITANAAGISKGKIIVCTSRESGSVLISIHDTGCGIPLAIQPRVFDLFFTTKEVGKGTGQGLALAHAVIVKKHGGHIWFETEIGHGTTFFIRLPAPLAADDSIQAQEEFV